MTTDPQNLPTLNGWVTSVIRTGVPMLWALLLTFLAGKVPALETVLTAPEVVGLGGSITLAVGVAWYAVMRWLEPKLPPWLTRLVIGSNKTPTYDPDVRVIEISAQTGKVINVYDEPADVAARRFPDAGQGL